MCQEADRQGMNVSENDRGRKMGSVESEKPRCFHPSRLASIKSVLVRVLYIYIYIHIYRRTDTAHYAVIWPTL